MCSLKCSPSPVSVGCQPQALSGYGTHTPDRKPKPEDHFSYSYVVAVCPEKISFSDGADLFSESNQGCTLDVTFGPTANKSMASFFFFFPQSRPSEVSLSELKPNLNIQTSGLSNLLTSSPRRPNGPSRM